MWLSDRMLGRLTSSWSACGILLLFLLSGCGFQPLYGTSVQQDVPAQFQQVYVQVIPDRIGQQIRNYLLDRLNPQGQPSRPLYTLKVEPSVSRTNLGIKRDETATRAVMNLDVNFFLADARSGKVLFSGYERSVNSFNIVDSDFATLSAEKDALDRAAREVSNAIRLRLGIYFRTGS
jgi:LPS-assembly lipoprotein